MKQQAEVIIRGVRFRFLFTPVLVPGGKKYFISSIEEGHLSICFELTWDESNHWKVLPPAPDWILENEALLGETVSKHDSAT